MVDGTDRRVLAHITHYPTAQEIAEAILAYQGEYKTKTDFYTKRDRALAAILFICQLRKSEAHRLVKAQFKEHPLRIEAMKLSKAEKRSTKTNKIITRKQAYRTLIPIPTRGKLGVFGKIVQEYLDELEPKDRLFKFKDGSGYTNKIIAKIFSDKYPPHWLRAFGENLLYELFDNDLIAVANHVQVDPRTLAKYVHRTPEKYLKKLK